MKKVFYILLCVGVILAAYFFIAEVYPEIIHYKRLVDGMDSFLQEQYQMCIDFGL